MLVLTKVQEGRSCGYFHCGSYKNMIGVFLSPVLILGYLGVWVMTC
jgi:hypothetical protein